jgi:hypothetical protein
MHFIIYLDFISHNMLADLSKIGKDLIKKMIVGRIWEGPVRCIGDRPSS